MAAAYRQLGMIRKVDGVIAKEIILIIEEQDLIPDQNGGGKKQIKHPNCQKTENNGLISSNYTTFKLIIK